ncbi:unnamed protein product [Soboliphyme baturini]|uniref:ANK_REP_REGION domain-containing protein n=1 Tax=Soboliphyme baturini TaxID=241478 RepID=A0A183IIZ2_9BILA|nr:unnamed protein product [Soboliphyme baturini]
MIMVVETLIWLTTLSRSQALPDVARSASTIFELIEAGDLLKLKEIFDSSCVELINENGETPLIVASRHNAAEIVDFLLKNDADPNAKDNEWFSALLNAAQCGFTEVCEALIDAGADIEDSDIGGWTPLVWACYRSRLPVVHLLLKRGASVNLIDEFGNNALLWACRKNATQIAQELIEAGSNSDVIGMKGMTPLIFCSKWGNVELVAMILEHTSNINAVDFSGMTALAYAAVGGYHEKKESILMKSVKNEQLQVIKDLLDHHADLDYKDEQSRTALHVAVDKGQLDIVSLLLQYLPNTEIRNKDGDTPLLRAARCKNLIAAQLLIQAGANVGAADKVGDTCLHIAARCRSIRLMKILLSRPQDTRLLYQPNKRRETPYSIDRASGKPMLPHIFGPLESTVKIEAMMGYELYSSILADIMCSPILSLPVFVGLFAKWGSGNFIFAEYRRLSTYDGEHALANVVQSFYDELEKYYGFLPVTFARAIRSEYCRRKELSFRRFCGIPVAVICVFIFVNVILGLSLCLSYLTVHNDAVLLAGLVILIISLSCLCYPLGFLAVHMFLFRPQQTVKRLLMNVDRLRLEAFMQNLRSHVELLEETVHRLDSYSHCQTRFVLFVDRLDSCEGSRILQTLDALQVLFGNQNNSPFIVLISVDPHIVISAVQPSLSAAFNKSEISGYDYLKLIIHMPLYLRNSEFVKLHQNLMQHRSLDPNRLKNVIVYFSLIVLFSALTIFSINWLVFNFQVFNAVLIKFIYI